MEEALTPSTSALLAVKDEAEKEKDEAAASIQKAALCFYLQASALESAPSAAVVELHVQLVADAEAACSAPELAVE